MSLAFRAYFALPTDIQTSSGVVTNALNGFASMLVSLIGSQNPRALAVAFDLPGGTFRDNLTEDYKGGRAETPPEIEHQFDLIRTMCETLHIPVLGVEHFEADDVLATLATWSRDAKIPVVVVSGDCDTFQLVEDPFIKVLYNRRGVSDYSLYDEAGIFERCGIEPARRRASLLWPRCAVTPRTIGRACRAWARRPRRNSSHSIATSTTSTPTST